MGRIWNKKKRRYKRIWKGAGLQMNNKLKLPTPIGVLNLEKSIL